MRPILKFVTPIMIVLSSVGAASAADHSEARKSFEGFYLGAFGGYSGAKLEGIHDSRELVDCDYYDNTTSPCPADAEIFSGDWTGAGTFGGYIGYNVEHSGLIFGIEADLGGTDINGKAVDSDGVNDYANQEVNWIGSIRARVGTMAGDSTMLYVTGGIGYIDADFTAFNNMEDCEDPGEGDCASGSADISGFTPVVGGGVEHLLTENIALRVEGLYYFATGTNRFNEGELTTDTDDGDYGKIGGLYQVRGGISYRF